MNLKLFNKLVISFIIIISVMFTFGNAGETVLKGDSISTELLNKEQNSSSGNNAIVLSAILFTVLLMYIYGRRIKSQFEIKTANIIKQKNELNNLLNSFDKNVIFSKTDLKGNIIHVSSAFCKISGYSKEELIGKPHNLVRSPDMPKELFKQIWDSLKKGESITKEIKNLRKDGIPYWVESRFEPDYDEKGSIVGFSAIRQDITAKKEVQELSQNLESIIDERTKNLEGAKEEVEQILASILLPVLITDKETRKIVYANRYAETQYDTTLEDMIGSTIEDLYVTKGQSEDLVNQMRTNGAIKNLEQDFLTHSGKKFTALLSVIPITYRQRPSYIGMTTDISELKRIEKEIRKMHKNTQDSIEYASLIQYALIPPKESFEQYFDEFFTIWEPKDIVGGDIYLFEYIKTDSQCILMVIDCTGHGVPGAFVTMLVKAIERQVVAIINNNDFIEVSPAWILGYFNRTMKSLLKQEGDESISNAGFDGGIFYYNKDENIIKYAGAQTPLFYFDTNGELTTIKGDRHSVGYKKSDMSYEFTDHTIEVQSGMSFYITTDGYIDQNGGSKDFPFGKRRLTQLLKDNYKKPFNEQKELLQDTIKKYQGEKERNDDITFVGLKIK